MTLTRGASTSAEDRQADAAIDIARRLKRIETVGHRHPDGPYLSLGAGGTVLGTTTFSAARTQFPLVDVGLSAVHGGSYGGLHWRAAGPGPTSPGQYLIMSDGSTTFVSTPSSTGNISLRASANGGYQLNVNANGQHSVIGDLNMNNYYVRGGNTGAYTTDSDSGLFGVSDGLYSLRSQGAAKMTVASNGVWMETNRLYLYVYADTNHWIGYDATPNGPRICAYGGMDFFSVAGGGQKMAVSQQGHMYCQGQLKTNYAQGSGTWGDASLLINPGTNTAAIAFHSGGVAPQFRVSTNDMTIYVRDTNGISPSNISAAACVSTSSRRYKRNISPWPAKAVGAAVQGALDIIESLAPHTYQWAHDVVSIPQDPRRLAAYMRLSDYNRNRSLPAYELPLHDCATDYCGGTADDPCKLIREHATGKIGLMAEDTYEVLPQAVTLTVDNQPDGIDYAVVTAVLVAAVQELAARVAALEPAAG